MKFSNSGGSRGRVWGARNPPPPPPIRPHACLRLKFMHRQDRISFFNWLIFLMKRKLHFVTKLNSKDASFTSRIEVQGKGQGIITCNHVWWEGVCGEWGRSNLPQKSSTILSEPKFGPTPPPLPPNKKFLDPPLSKMWRKLNLLIIIMQTCYCWENQNPSHQRISFQATKILQLISHNKS